MGTEELLSIINTYENKEASKYLGMATDEYCEEQYEDAATHFNKAFEAMPECVWAKFMRALAVAHTGTKGNCASDAETLSSALIPFAKKITEQNASDLFAFSIKEYFETMELFLNNAIEHNDRVLIRETESAKLCEVYDYLEEKGKDECIDKLKLWCKELPEQYPISHRGYYGRHSLAFFGRLYPELLDEAEREDAENDRASRAKMRKMKIIKWAIIGGIVLFFIACFVAGLLKNR